MNLKKAVELYQGRWCEVGDYSPIYDPIIQSFGDILLRVDEPEYKGDSFVLFKDGAGYAYLEFGWGTCSGCDRLCACENFEDVDRLILELYQSMRRFESRQEALDFFNTHDWAGDWAGRKPEQKEFVEKAKNILNAQP